MNKLVKHFTQTCTYIVLLLLGLYVVLAIIGSADKAIPPTKFLLISFYAAIITLAGAVYTSLKLTKLLKLSIHYAILLLGFIAVYLMSGVVQEQYALKIFYAVLIFTTAYAAIAGSVFGIRAALTSKPSSDTDDGTSEIPTKAKTETKSGYRPRFTDLED